eukprot:CAMPEP_0197516532 /NCGR_PEP_ID=MMETSP1318-20131121/1423_1 /TAXON_ID=552666 /ORGANISM="Partenskyella glossopodia, Strain RCC365" /LENGTH=162 /DNA_ID=CAMNT_0043065347 /DNA_START=401 /DNA_END=889 /DNA_ORIENTATION=-
MIAWNATHATNVPFVFRKPSTMFGLTSFTEDEKLISDNFSAAVLKFVTAKTATDTGKITDIVSSLGNIDASASSRPKNFENRKDYFGKEEPIVDESVSFLENSMRALGWKQWSVGDKWNMMWTSQHYGGSRVVPGYSYWGGNPKYGNEDVCDFWEKNLPLDF